jgi:predicted small secreted protein
MTRILALILFVFGAVAVTGCNTLQGTGQDIENAGEELEDATEG